MSRSLLLAIILFALPYPALAARLWSTGCEFQSDTPNTSLRTLLEFTDGIATSTNGNLTSYTTIKHSGDASCRMKANGANSQAQGRNMFLQVQTALDVYFRTYFYLVTLPDENAGIIELWDRGIDGLEGAVILETDGQLHLQNDDGGHGASGATTLNAGQWYRLEVNYDASAEMTLYIDGVSEVSTTTNITGSIDAVNINMCDNSGTTCGGNGISTGEWLFDDVAVNDTTGTAQTSFPGAGSIVYMQPDSAGDSNGCLSGDSTSVDEITPDDGTTICVLDADTGGDIIDVNVESSSNAGIGSTDTISVILVGIREGAASAAPETWNVRIKSASGGTTSSGSSRANAATTYKTNAGAASTVGSYTLASYLDPTTGVAWTPTGTNSLDNMQIGANASDGNPNINVSTLWALVEYTPAAAPASSAPDDGLIWFE